MHQTLSPKTTYTEHGNRCLRKVLVPHCSRNNRLRVHGSQTAKAPTPSKEEAIQHPLCPPTPQPLQDPLACTFTTMRCLGTHGSLRSALGWTCTSSGEEQHWEWVLHKFQDDAHGHGCDHSQCHTVLLPEVLQDQDTSQKEVPQAEWPSLTFQTFG